MVYSQSELEVISKSTVRLSVTVELTLPYKRSRKVPWQDQSSLEAVNELLSTMSKLRLLPAESLSDGQEKTEEWANVGNGVSDG